MPTFYVITYLHFYKTHSLISNRKLPAHVFGQSICSLTHSITLYSGQVKVFVHAMFEFNNNAPKFKLEVRDFLIQLKEFAGENAELYLEEKESELEAQRKAEMAKALSIPGMVKPSELPVMDEDEAL